MNTKGSQSMAELFEEEKKLRRKLLDMRFDQACGKLFDIAAPKKARRQLARVLTKINMRNL